MPYINRHQSLKGLDENLIKKWFLILKRRVLRETLLRGLSLHVSDFS